MKTIKKSTKTDRTQIDNKKPQPNRQKKTNKSKKKWRDRQWEK